MQDLFVLCLELKRKSKNSFLRKKTNQKRFKKDYPMFTKCLSFFNQLHQISIIFKCIFPYPNVLPTTGCLIDFTNPKKKISHYVQGRADLKILLPFA